MAKQPTSKSSDHPCIETLEAQSRKKKSLQLTRQVLVFKSINDDGLKLSVPDSLVDPGDVLTNGPVIATGHADHAVDANMIESLKVLLAVHLELQPDPDELVHGPRPLEVFASWGRSVGAIEEGLVELGIERYQTAREGGAERRDDGEGGGQGWSCQEVVDERSGASLGDAFHPICTVHAGGFVKRGDDGLKQFDVDDRSAKMSDEFLFKDFREPNRKLRVQSAKVER